MPYRELLRLKFAGVTVEDAHTVFENISGRIALERLSPSWLIFNDGFRKNRFLLAAKRSMDIAAALIAITLTLPIMALVAAAILIESGGPVLFRQKRVGLNGDQFEIFQVPFHAAGRWRKAVPAGLPMATIASLASAHSFASIASTNCRNSSTFCTAP